MVLNLSTETLCYCCHSNPEIILSLLQVHVGIQGKNVANDAQNGDEQQRQQEFRRNLMQTTEFTCFFHCISKQN